MDEPIGTRFGKWEVIGHERVWHKAYAGRKNGWWANELICRCECGTVALVYKNSIRAGKTRGCQRCNTTSSKHSLYKHKLYRVWGAMVQRCENEANCRYQSYGARGIKLCESWRTDPREFINWCMVNGWKQGLQIDRINNDGNYSPDNCIFVTTGENARKQITGS